MSTLDLRSSYLQAVGYLRDHRVMCSSYGLGSSGIDVGPVDLASPQGVRLHLHMRFAFGRDGDLVSLERDHYFVVIDRQLPISTNTSTPDTVLALYSTVDGSVLAEHGQARANWFSRLPANSQRPRWPLQIPPLMASQTPPCRTSGL